MALQAIAASAGARKLRERQGRPLGLPGSSCSLAQSSRGQGRRAAQAKPLPFPGSSRLSGLASQAGAALSSRVIGFLERAARAGYRAAQAALSRGQPLIGIGFPGRSSPFPGSSRESGVCPWSSQPSPEQPEPAKPLPLPGSSRIGFPGRSSPFPASSRLSGLASQGGAAPLQGAAAYPDWLPREEQPRSR